MLILNARRIDIRKIYFYLLIAVFSFVFLLNNSSISEEKTKLFTKHEAKLLRYSDHEWKKEVLPANPPDTIDHPSIIFENPPVEITDKGPTINVVDPTNVLITIKQNDSPLDPGTLKVWGEKFFVHIDVTNRVLKYFKTTKTGAVLKADDIHMPKGHFKVGISIADVNGNKMEKKYRLVVQ